MSELLSYSVALKSPGINCPTTIKNGAAAVPSDVKPQLSCALFSSAVPAGASSDDFWDEIWSGSGACVSSL
jgi:hypothetical protein